MAAIIGRPETIAGLFPGEGLGTLTRGIIAAVDNSFETQAMRNPTKEEIKKRFNICIDTAKMLRGDLQWGIARIVDILPEVLKYELNGAKWMPATTERSLWVPSDGR